MVSIVPAGRQWAADWLRQRCALWPDESATGLREDIEAWFEGRASHLLEVLFAVGDDGRLLGFAELNVRPYAEGCYSGNVAFLEAWYVEPDNRGCGVGAALIRAAEAWAVARGCTELASDALADNALGAAAHLGVGFVEVETIRCFRKGLPPPGGAQAPAVDPPD